MLHTGLEEIRKNTVQEVLSIFILSNNLGGGGVWSNSGGSQYDRQIPAGSCVQA